MSIKDPNFVANLAHLTKVARERFGEPVVVRWEFDEEKPEPSRWEVTILPRSDRSIVLAGVFYSDSGLGAIRLAADYCESMP